MSRILVTGGAGFLGSHLCARLMKEGNEVLCVDNLCTGSMDNIRELFGMAGFTFLKQDVAQLPDSWLYQIDGIHQIYNLACPASPPHYQADPVKTAKTSVFGILNMLELARRCHAKILQASTSEVYGDPQVHPQAESYRGCVNPIGIRACYDEGKRMAETLMFDYRRMYGVDIKVIRIFNTYGPKMDPGDGRVVSNFIVQALRGEDLTIYGDGSQTRSFCYVNDLIDGMIRMMNSADGFCGPVNLGNPGEFTMLELAQKVTKLTNSRSRLVYQKLPQDDPAKRRPVINLAERELGWKPETELDKGLEETIAYFRKVLNISQEVYEKAGSRDGVRQL